MNKRSELKMIEYIEISGIKTIVRLPDNYLCGRKYKVIFINDGEIVNNIEQPDNQIYVGLIPKNRLAAYTPWPYKAIREGAEDFGGECREYHNQLVGEIVPYISKHYNVYAESMHMEGIHWAVLLLYIACILMKHFLQYFQSAVRSGIRVLQTM